MGGLKTRNKSYVSMNYIISSNCFCDYVFNSASDSI